MARNSNVERLKGVALFSACNDRELDQIGRAADEVSVDAGRDLVTEGSAGHEFYMILEGTAAVSRGGSTVAELGPGEYFGEMAVLDGAPRNATVTTTEPSKLLLLGQREFGAVIDGSPGVARKLLVNLAARLREAEEQAVTH